MPTALYISMQIGIVLLLNGKAVIERILAEIYQIKAQSLICQRKPLLVPHFLFFSVHLERAMAALLFLTVRIKITLEGEDGCQLLRAVI